MSWNGEHEGLLLLGGASSRFGSDKMVAQLGYEPLCFRAWRALSQVCSHVNVSVARGASASFEDPPPRGSTWSWIPDQQPGRGPLGGIHTALSLKAKDMLVVAGDLPRVQPSTLTAILEAGRDSGAVIIVARARESGKAQPLCGLWHASVQQALRAYLDAGHRSVFGFLDQQDVEWVDVDDRYLININRPEDLDLLTGMS